jgi:hypothetical protein
MGGHTSCVSAFRFLCETVGLRFTLKVCEDAIHDDFGSLVSAAFDAFCDKGMCNTLWNPCVYNLFFRQQSLAAQECKIQRQLPSPETLSKENVQFIQNWLNDWGVKQRAFIFGHSSTFPWRVIDVGTGGEDPRLVDTPNTQEKYTALSYCWGKPTPSQPPFKTEKKNINQRLDGISVSHMP